MQCIPVPSRASLLEQRRGSGEMLRAAGADDPAFAGNVVPGPLRNGSAFAGESPRADRGRASRSAMDVGAGMSRYWSELAREAGALRAGGAARIAGLVKLNTNESFRWPSPKSPGGGDNGRGAGGYAAAVSGPASRRGSAQSLAAYHGVEPGQVFVGNGSDEELLARTFAGLLKQDAPLLFPDVTYSFYPVYCRLFGIAHETVPLDEGMRVRVDTRYLRRGGG